MRRALFWIGVALTIALVGVGIWYYVRDDYPFQLSSTEITGLSYRSVGAAGAVSGYIVRPPPELADWISSMEKDSSDQSVPVTTVVTIVRSDGPALRLAIGGNRGFASWLQPSGSTATAPVGVQLGPAFVWYLRGVGDALAASHHTVTPRQPPTAAPSPTPSPIASPSPSPTS